MNLTQDECNAISLLLQVSPIFATGERLARLVGDEKAVDVIKLLARLNSKLNEVPQPEEPLASPLASRYIRAQEIITDMIYYDDEGDCYRPAYREDARLDVDFPDLKNYDLAERKS